MPYISYLTRVVKICQTLLNNANITKLDVKTLSTTFAPLFADTSILEPDLNPPPNMENVISIFTIFYDLLFVPIMQQINAELQAANQAANILKRQESIRPGLHRRNSLSFNGQQGDNLAAMTMSLKNGLDKSPMSQSTTPRSRSMLFSLID